VLLPSHHPQEEEEEEEKKGNWCTLKPTTSELRSPIAKLDVDRLVGWPAASKTRPRRGAREQAGDGHASQPQPPPHAISNTHCLWLKLVSYARLVLLRKPTNTRFFTFFALFFQFHFPFPVMQAGSLIALGTWVEDRKPGHVHSKNGDAV
jgi:hypothetical protein